MSDFVLVGGRTSRVSSRLWRIEVFADGGL